MLGEPLQLGAGLAVLGIQLEGGAGRVEGAQLVAAARLPEAGRLAEDRHLLLRVLREGEAILVELDEQAPVVLPLAEKRFDEETA